MFLQNVPVSLITISTFINYNFPVRNWHLKLKTKRDKRWDEDRHRWTLLLSIVKGLLNYSILKFWQKKLFENESQLVKDVAVSFCWYYVRRQKYLGVENRRFLHYHTNWFHSPSSVSLLMESFVCRILTTSNSIEWYKCRYSSNWISTF